MPRITWNPAPRVAAPQISDPAITRATIRWTPILLLGMLVLVVSLLVFPAIASADLLPGALWTQPNPAPLLNVAATPNGAVFAGCSGYTRAGAIAWDLTAAYPKGCTSISDPQGNTYLEGVAGTSVQSVDATGHVRWTTPVPGITPPTGIFSIGPVLGANGAVYFTQFADNTVRLIGLNRNTGAVVLDQTTVPSGSALVGTLHTVILSADADGLVLLAGGDNNLIVRYLSYSGALLHEYETLPTRDASIAIGANGAVYIADHVVAGDDTCGGGLAVEKFTPSGRGWQWTDPSDIGCRVAELAATPDGGVVLQRISGDTSTVGGIHNTLTSLSPSGAVRWTKQAPFPVFSFSDPGAFYLHRLFVDNAGTIVWFLHQTADCTGGKTYCAKIQFFKQTTGGTALPASQLPGDGVTEDLNDVNAAIDTGRVYLETATDISDPSTDEVSAFPMPGLGIDYQLAIQEALAGGGTVTPPPPPPPATPPAAPTVREYVALGDSFASGEGVEPFFEPHNSCHRSKLAYPTQVQVPNLNRVTTYYAQRKSKAYSWGFLACSGAVSDDVLTKQLAGSAGDNVNYRPVTKKTELVTVTVGGDDAGFANVLEFCAFRPSCESKAYGGYASLTKYVDARLPYVGRQVLKVYKQIHKLAPHATVLVLGYPQLFPGSVDEQRCGKLRLAFGTAEQTYLRSATERLNSTLQQEVASAGSWAKWIPVAGRFAGHEICGDKSEWINAVTFKRPGLTAPISPNSQSFHPNDKGQRAYADAINDFLDSVPTF